MACTANTGYLRRNYRKQGVAVVLDHKHVLSDEQLVDMYSKVSNLNCGIQGEKLDQIVVDMYSKVSDLNCGIQGEKLDKIVESITKIEYALNGNGRKGILSTVDQHDRYFQMIAGGSALASIIFLGIRIFL